MAVEAAASSVKKWLRHLPALLGVCLLFGAIYVVQKEFRNLKLEDIAVALEAIPNHALLMAFIWTVLAYGVLTFYDRLGTIYAGHKVSYGRVAFASFCAYALSHNLGFAAVSGAAVRYRLYAMWGLTPLQIAKVVAFCSLTFGLGGMVLGGSILFLEPDSVPFFGDKLPLIVMYLIGGAMFAIVIAYVSIAKVIGTIRLFGHEVQLPGGRMAILQVLLATVDVAVTASIFYALLPHTPGLTWWRFLGVYLASYTAGLAASLPGGLGVFDTAILLGLSPYMEAPVVVGAIVVFRLFYYIIPLFLAGSMFAGNEILMRGSSLVRRSDKMRGVQAVARWSEPDFAVAALTGVVALCGALLLGLGVLAAHAAQTRIDPDVSSIAAQAGEFVPSLIGAALLVLSISLSQRVTLAWGSTIVLLLAAAAFTAVRGERLWIPAVMVLAALLVAPFRRSFYRHARLITGPLQGSTVLPLFALVACVLALTAFERHVRGLAANSWWEVILSRDVPNGLRLAVALTVFMGLLATWRLMRPSHVTFGAWDADARLRYATLGGDPPSRADGILWGEADRAGIPFRRVGPVLLGLGDPVGSDSDRISVIWRLRDLARQEGLDPAIWRAGTAMLSIYADIGLAALPLGVDGLPLPESDGDDTPRASSFLACVAERDLGTLLPLLPELAAASRVGLPRAAE
jgi:uncharacterized membrane protein YbhN (UPF0104 family)